MACDRCHRETVGHTVSMFNTDTVCFDCKRLEETHPDYARARRRELEAVQRGDYNYHGVGLPAGYAQWAAAQAGGVREWKNAHAADCPVTEQRVKVLADLALDPGNAYLLGALPEYDEGGDQEAEACECAVRRPRVRRYLDVRYDVTGLDDEEVGQLALEAAVQAERSDGHPSVEVESEVVDVDDEAPEAAPAPVPAGPAPRPVEQIRATVEHRGVEAWVSIEEYEDDPDRFVTLRFYASPAPRGLDENLYTYSSFPVPRDA